MNFSQHNRPQFIAKAESTEFDLLVIGGGITGCGIALDAALRGLKVALIEKKDFGFGTSSRSTKLIHGGLRYLKQFELKLVRDVGRERAIVHRNARHVVLPEKMLLPIVKDGSLGKQSSSLCLLVYDILAGVKRQEQRIMLNKHFTLEAEPLLDETKVTGGGLYFEYRTDDARLVIELAKSAFSEGALLLNYCEAKKFIKNQSGKVAGIEVEDKTSNKTFTIKAKKTVNAAGPWVDVLRKEDGSLTGKRLQLTKGVHIVFPYEKIPLKQAVYFDAPDGRMIFAIPRNGITYVGTTDTVYNQDIDSPRAVKADVEYLLKAVNAMFPSVDLKSKDVISSWAGLRPLIHEDGKSPSELSRKDEIIIAPSGLISIAGGKLTGFRLMAEKVVNLVSKLLKDEAGSSFASCTTKKYLLSGGKFNTREELEKHFEELKSNPDFSEIEDEKLRTLFHRYGSEVQKVLSLLSKQKGSNIDEQILFAELDYCIANESVYHAEDFLVCRTGNLFFAHPQTIEFLDKIIETLAIEWHWNNNQKEAALKSVAALFNEAVTFE